MYLYVMRDVFKLSDPLDRFRYPLDRGDALTLDPHVTGERRDPAGVTRHKRCPAWPRPGRRRARNFSRKPKMCVLTRCATA